MEDQRGQFGEVFCDSKGLISITTHGHRHEKENWQKESHYGALLCIHKATCRQIGHQETYRTSSSNTQRHALEPANRRARTDTCGYCYRLEPSLPLTCTQAYADDCQKESRFSFSVYEFGSPICRAAQISSFTFKVGSALFSLQSFHTVWSQYR